MSAPPGRPDAAPGAAARRGSALGLTWRLFVTPPAAVLLGTLCTALAAALLLTLPRLAATALDTASGADGAVPDHALRFAGWFAACALGETLLRRTARLLLIRRSRHAEAALKDHVVHHLQRTRIPDLDRLRSGDVVSRLTQDVELLRFTTGPALLYGVQALVLLPGGVLALHDSSAPLALAAAVPLAAIVLALVRLTPAIQRHARAVQDQLGEIGGHAGEVLAALRFVRAARRETLESAQMTRAGDALARRKVDLARSRARADLAIHLGVQLALLAGLVLGGREVLAGRATNGQLLELYAMLGLVLQPLLAAGFLVASVPRARAAAQRLDELLELPTDATELDVAGPPRGAHPPRIDFDGVTCRDAPGEIPRLDGVTLAIAPGESLGIAGPVGAGKSLLLDVLLRFRDPDAGALRIDGRNAHDLAPAALRRYLAYVAQDPFLFGDTLAANLRLAAPDAGDEALHAALADAGLAAEVAAWPEGLDTPIGERGVTLSGGQRQRVALARALLADRPVLVLDDALSAVDHTTEHAILAALARRHVGRTAQTRIIVSHRLSAVREADRIAVLDAGRLVEVGSHAELCARPGPYRRSYRAQVESAALGGAAPPDREWPR